MAYAENTSVSSAKSRMEIEQTLSRYGADSFCYGWESDNAIIMFRVNGYHIKFDLTMPNRSADEFRFTPKGKERTESSQHEAYEQAVRQRWRALALVIKAKLEAITIGISCCTFETEFLSHIVLPDGQQVKDLVVPKVRASYESGKMPARLLTA